MNMKRVKMDIFVFTSILISHFIVRSNCFLIFTKSPLY